MPLEVCSLIGCTQAEVTEKRLRENDGDNALLKQVEVRSSRLLYINGLLVCILSYITC